MASMRRKLVIVGDGGSGKTCLLNIFDKEPFPEVSILPVPVKYVSEHVKARTQAELQLWDTPQHQDCDKFRSLLYLGADVILMCFSIDSQQSLRNITVKWVPEVKHFCSNVPIILVGNKKDLKNDNTIQELAAIGKKLVTSDQGHFIAKKINAVCYLEVSAKTKEGVLQVYEMASRAAFQVREQNQKHCIII